MDRHGSGALLWAAGGGHLPACRFLVEVAGIDPTTTAQAGRRAYSGRTALHWAARNGHVDVVEYLVSERGMDVDARTAEGTTAFAWACWQGEVNTARWLVERGGCSFGAVNTFGRGGIRLDVHVPIRASILTHTREHRAYVMRSYLTRDLN